MAKMRRTKSEEEANFSEDFFRMEEISCENEQEDSAKNLFEKESAKGSLGPNKEPLEQYEADDDEIHI